MITIGFWGAAISLSKVNYLAGGIVCLVAGLVMFSVVGSLRYRKWSNHRKSIERCLRLGRIGKLNSRIKRLEVQLDKEVKNLEKALKNKQRLREG
jgi:hypothetical protein